MAVQAADSSLKRTLEHGDAVFSNKQRRLYKHHHTIRPLVASVEPREPVFVDPETADRLLLDSIKVIVEREATKIGVDDPVIESLALTAFRNAVEEYMLRFCSKVQRSMRAARRTVPIATDFESAIASLDVPLLSDQVQALQYKRETELVLLPTPPPEDPFHKHAILPPALLGPELGAQEALKAFHRNPKFLPPLPSAHTYRTTSFLPPRENDSRRIRELATDEGKLGEQALRKLAGAVKLDAAHPVDPETHKEAVSSKILPVRSRRLRRKSFNEAAVFEDTMRNFLKGEVDGFELGPMVTAEKGFRMPEDSQLKRRPTPPVADMAPDTESSSRRLTESRMEGVEVTEL